MNLEVGIVSILLRSTSYPTTYLVRVLCSTNIALCVRLCVCYLYQGTEYDNSGVLGTVL